MGKKYTLPADVRLECIAYVKGYPRRVQAYKDARYTILTGSATQDGMPGAFGTGRPAENKAEQLAGLESWESVRKMRAVEYAMEQVGRGVQSAEVRRKMIRAIVQSCENRNKFPLERATGCGYSVAAMKRRKAEFLWHIADYLDLVS